MQFIKKNLCEVNCIEVSGKKLNAESEAVKEEKSKVSILQKKTHL